MQTILIVIHLLIVIALVVVVLLQRSEGGGLGMGGGGAMSARQGANPLTRLTVILGAAFFATSVGLGLLGRYGDNPANVLDRIPAIGQTEPGQQVPSSGGVLDLLGPANERPAAPAAGAPSQNGVPTEGGAPNPGSATTQGSAPSQSGVPGGTVPTTVPNN